MLSKIIDNRMLKYGYRKTEENSFAAYYLKHEKNGNYNHAVCILEKSSGHHILQSCDEESVMINDHWGNETAGIEIPVLLLMWLKGKQMARKYKWKGVKNDRRKSIP